MWFLGLLRYLLLSDSHHLKPCLVTLLCSPCPPRPTFSLHRPITGPDACTASLRSLCTESPVSILRVLSNIDALGSTAAFTTDSPAPILRTLPSPLCSPAAVTTEPLTCASPLTERALRSQRRDALRASHDVVSSPTSVHPLDTLAASVFRAQISNSCIQYSTPQRLASVYYSTSDPAPRATMRVANPPPFNVRVAPPRAFAPLASLRVSHSMSSRNLSTMTSPKNTTGTSAQATARMASPPPSAPGPLLDLPPMDPADLQASTGSRTGRTPGLRPSVPMPRASLATTGPPPHLAYLASIWTTLGPEHRAKLGTVSLHDVEEGLARARVSTQDDAITAADCHATELATAEHKRLVASLHEKKHFASTLRHCPLRHPRARGTRRLSGGSRTPNHRRHHRGRTRPYILPLRTLCPSAGSAPPRGSCRSHCSAASRSGQPYDFGCPPRPTAYGSGRLGDSNGCRRGTPARFPSSCPN